MEVSERYHNDTYAPGIATYGISGKNGEQGAPGMSMFFTDYSLPDEFADFAKKITSRKVPVKAETIILDRTYVNGDTFVTANGKVFMLLDINTLSISTFNNDTLTDEQISNIIKLVGVFSTTEGPFKTSSNILSRGKSLTISESAVAVAAEDKKGLLNLIKNTTNTNTVDFINMSINYTNAANINFDIKYDNRYSAYVLSSQYPIIIDGNLYVKYNDSNKLNSNEYSPVLTKDDNSSITDFISTCKEVSYSVSATIYTYNETGNDTVYYGVLYTITLENTDNLIKYYGSGSNNITIHYQNSNSRDFLLFRSNELTYYFKEDYGYITYNEAYNRASAVDKNALKISLIDNFDVYLTQTSFITPTVKRVNYVNFICIVENTNVTLSDGSYKSVQDITYDDDIYVYDTVNDVYTSAKPYWIMKTINVNSYVKVTFNDGSSLSVSRGSDGHCHRLYCPTKSQFIQADLLLNEIVQTKDGIKKVISIEDINDSVNIYNIMTEKHLDFYADDVLTGSGLLNEYNKEQKIPYTMFEKYNISYDDYEGFALYNYGGNIENIVEYIDKLNGLKK